jgi:hypothetical protein
MVRKDFILQNFVGTGGSCDARAVRCHERIARWHAMCEHQLSHISQFVVAQSQQNIQELGQTMKTLNQYYDDSMNRSLVEVPDKDGNETRTDPSAFLGCASDVIQGNSPVDFDGTPLMNDQSSPALPLRLINGNCASTPHHGTAEPEMRGLYILLTMNNDGGMEVLKYASQLFRERPEIYHGKPIQLALSIYKVSLALLYPVLALLQTWYQHTHPRTFPHFRQRKNTITQDFSRSSVPPLPHTCLLASCSSTLS